MRLRSFGGFFIHASVKVCNPYLFFVYARMAHTWMGGASKMVAGWTISLPKSGVPCLSSIIKTWVMPAL